MGEKGDSPLFPTRRINRRGEVMRIITCVVAVVLMLAGAALYAMEPSGVQVPGEEPKAMAFKPGSEPAEGFEDVRWGAPLREFPGLALSRCGVFDVADLCRYRVVDSGEEAEDVEVSLLFWRERLFGLELSTLGSRNWVAFRNMVFEEFGGPPSPAAGTEFRWEGERALAHLHYFRRSRAASLLVVSAEIGDEMERSGAFGE